MKNETPTENRYIKKYDVFNNMADRETVRIFDARHGHKGFFPTLVELGLARYSEMYPNGAINEILIEEVSDIMEKFKACNDLIKLSEYAKKKQAMKLI